MCGQVDEIGLWMILETELGSTYIRKDDKNLLRWFEHVERRHVEFVVRRVDQIEGSQIASRPYLVG
jgi:hypothetical protein